MLYLDWYLLDEYREFCIWIDYTYLTNTECCIWIDTYLMNTECVVSGLILTWWIQRVVSGLILTWRIERVFERNETKIHVHLLYILGFMVHVKLINIVRVQTKLCVIYIGMSRFTNMVFTTILITGKCTIKNNWDNFIFSIKIDYFNRACHIFDSKYMISHAKAKVLKNSPKNRNKIKLK